MKKFIIENDFWEVFPEAKIGVILAKGIQNDIQNTAIFEALLIEASKEVAKHLPDEEFSQNSVIKAWRDAYQLFKTKKGARSSIEALLKRVKNGNQVGTINPLVDLYNAVSMRYALPCGGEDISTFVGDLRLTKAKGDEPFITLGSEVSEPPYAGEIVYKDEAGAVCRCWNWRESVRTMLTKETKDAFLCIESVDPARAEDFEAALEELKASITEHLGGSSEVFILDRTHPEIIIES